MVVAAILSFQRCAISSFATASRHSGARAAEWRCERRYRAPLERENSSHRNCQAHSNANNKSATASTSFRCRTLSGSSKCFSSFDRRVAALFASKSAVGRKKRQQPRCRMPRTLIEEPELCATRKTRKRRRLERGSEKSHAHRRRSAERRMKVMELNLFKSSPSSLLEFPLTRLSSR